MPGGFCGVNEEMVIKETGEKIGGKYRVMEAFPFVEGVLYYAEEEGGDFSRTRFVHAIGGLSRVDADELKRNRHEDILFPLQEAFVEGGVLYQVFYRLEGTLLAHSLEKDGPLPLDEALWILHGVSLHLLRLYEQGQFAVVHPQNILITSGKAIRFIYGGPLALLPHPAGGGEAEESLARCRSADTFALGALSYALLTGRRLTSQAPNPAPIRSFRSDVSPVLEKWVMRACSLDPAARPPLARMSEIFQRTAAALSVQY
ncbi:hypothetical protein SAMN04488025_12330 [Planifilum fulgidum]|uniref:Protein kinase domain-containing protein n=1 Tax=Planifilum fulgidum TaxID=201973 RepID=A0A1I2QG45_9BACL|nr:hypothetical protein SAMN04488025_12330 [Planifilum fulgidum]